MSNYTFNPHATAVSNAKLARRVSPALAKLVFAIALGVVGVGILALWLGTAHASLLLGPSLLLLSLTTWVRHGVLAAKPAAIGTTNRLDQLLPTELLPGYRSGLSGSDWWKLVEPIWQTRFIAARFGLPIGIVADTVSAYTPNEDELFDRATALSQWSGSSTLTTAALAVVLINDAPGAGALLTPAKITAEELTEGVGWITRLEDHLNAPRPIYGGIARDWAAGYTPTLNQFAENFSKQVEAVGSSFRQQERTSQLDALITSLSSATGSVVLVGDTGIGKTALLYGLADRLLRGETSGELRHHQVVSLSAATMLTRVQGAGDMERIVLTILGEAVGAGNIIVALDEAQLFFGQGTGAVNLSQILLPVVQARRLKLVLTLSPGDWQRLRSTNIALAGLLTPIVLSEPSQTDTLRLLADRALIMEHGRATTTYQAMRQAYNMSSRYDGDEANPGRSLKLLEASYSFGVDQFVTPASVDAAIESQYGVKVHQADAAEADTLLHLEDHIHERMINQSRAVSVVASALRRARAGVANPKRPIGSFLFLGPTGVGKTELARSLAALYFGAESNMIRLDMSEYQQPTDVTRLLASAADNPDGLLPKVKQQPFSVVLFDEIEKANPNILNLLLQLLDEGNLTDNQNKSTSFKDAIIIATSNAGADEIRRHIEAGEELETFEKQFTDDLISGGSFKPELLNRFDEIVLFRPLNEAELAQVVALLVTEVNHTLEPQKVNVELTPAAVTALVHAGYDPRLGARPMRRMVQRTVEDAVAGQILRGQAAAGTTIKLDTADLNLAAKTASAETPTAKTTPETAEATSAPDDTTEPLAAEAPSATSLHSEVKKAEPSTVHKLRQ